VIIKISINKEIMKMLMSNYQKQ